MPPLPGADGTRRTRAEYVTPSRRQRLLVFSIAAGSLLAVVLTALYLTGTTRVLSPGPLAEHHANLDTKCVQCHDTGKAVDDLRCERCHDSGLTDRLVQTTHVAMGRGDANGADLAKSPTCTTCHRDHLGRPFAMASVLEAECASCHRETTAVASHVEFAALRQGVSGSAGLKFSHDGHLNRYMRDRVAAGCEYCHKPTENRRGFVPITFDTNCSLCHLKGPALTYESGYVSPDLLIQPANLPPYWKARTAVTLTANSRDNLMAGNLRHRDGWILANALRLGTGMDNEGATVERLDLESRAAEAEAARAMRPQSLASDDALVAAIQGLAKEIEDLDKQMANPASAPSLDVLRASAAAIRTLGAELQSSAADNQFARQLAAQADVDVPQVQPLDQTAFDRRRKELEAIVDAIQARAPKDGALRREATRIAGDLEKLMFTPEGQGSANGLQSRVEEIAGLTRLLGALSGQSGPAARRVLDYARVSTAQNVAGGVSPVDLARARVELASVLNSIEPRVNEATRNRIAAVRQRLLSLTLTTGSPASLRSQRSRSQRMLDRLLVEQRLRAEAHRADLPEAFGPAAPPIADLNDADRTWLEELRRADDLPAPPVTDPDTLQGGLTSLLEGCLVCHDLDASNARLARVLVNEPVMPFARFNHAPHTTGTTCDSCHKSANTSKLATDINLPGIANCQSCHNPSQVETTCATCHVYHLPTLPGGGR